MPKDNVIIGVVEHLLAPALASPKAPSPLPRPGVMLRGAGSAFFDTAHPEIARQVRTLETLERTGWPAHIEVGAGQTIARVRIPDVGLVLRMLPLEAGRFEVVLDRGEGRFLIDSSTNKDDVALLHGLVDRRVFVVIIRDEDGPIVDVQILPDYVGYDTPPYNDVPCGPEVLAATSILEDPQAVDRAFRVVKAADCQLPDPDVGCIPFLFAQSGCWARAHRMCELLAEQQPAIVAAKVWLFGGSRVETPNVRECRVEWSWHVAAFVRVRTKRGAEVRVLDPSMFPSPVTLRTWRNAQNNPKASLFYGQREIYLQTEICKGRLEGMLPKGRETAVDLEIYRGMLTDICPGKAQPPPFSHCRIGGKTTPRRTSGESWNQASVGAAGE
jgi:hypothetical protein